MSKEGNNKKGGRRDENPADQATLVKNRAKRGGGEVSLKEAERGRRQRGRRRGWERRGITATKKIVANTQGNQLPGSNGKHQRILTKCRSGE